MITEKQKEALLQKILHVIVNDDNGQLGFFVGHSGY